MAKLNITEESLRAIFDEQWNLENEGSTKLLHTFMREFLAQSVKELFDSSFVALDEKHNVTLFLSDAEIPCDIEFPLSLLVDDFLESSPHPEERARLTKELRQLADKIDSADQGTK